MTHALPRPHLLGLAWGLCLFAPTPIFGILLVATEFWPALNAPGTGGLLYTVPLACLVLSLGMVAVSEGAIVDRVAVSLLTIVLMFVQFIVDLVVFGGICFWLHGFEGVF